MKNLKGRNTGRSLVNIILVVVTFVIGGCSRTNSGKYLNFSSRVIECDNPADLEWIDESSGCFWESSSMEFTIKSIKWDVKLIAKQTLELLEIQKNYLEIVDLKEDVAKVQALINKIKSENINNVGFSAITKVSESATSTLIANLKKIERLNDYQKNKLESGLYMHKYAIVLSWGRSISLSKSLLKIISLRTQSYAQLSDEGLMTQNFIEDAKLALKFVEKSRETYEKHAEAFAYEAKIPIPANQRKLDLEPISII